MSVLQALRPVALNWPITQRWGVRNASYTAGYHTGIDYGVPIGTPIVSPRSGRVIVAKYDSNYGYHVEIQNWMGTKVYLLAHMSHLRVSTGQKVKRGQLVGLSGDTGNATGPHLHAEQRHSPFGYYNTENPTWN